MNEVAKKRALLESVQTLIHAFTEEEIDQMLLIVARTTERLLAMPIDKDGYIRP